MPLLCHSRHFVRQAHQSCKDLQRNVFTVMKQVYVMYIKKTKTGDGHTLAEVFIILPDSEKFLNEEQISSGNAYLQKLDAGKCPNESALKNAEEIAQSKKLGVWGSFERNLKS